MLHALSDIVSAMHTGTAATMKAVKYYLNYAASNPNAEILYQASNMILQLDSDAAYLVNPPAQSCAGGYFYLSNLTRTTFNGPIYILAKIIKNIMVSASKAKIAGIFLNAQQAVPLWLTLIEMGHPQPPTPICTNN